METIQTYLENMFRTLPATAEVLRAKDELYQMMEDKYLELKKEGKSENEAIGIVISEFGNLNEIAEDLGIKNVITLKKEHKESGKLLSLEEIKLYLKKKKTSSFFLAFGVLLCIVSCIGPIIGDAIANRANTFSDGLQAIGVIAMFLCIAIAVGCFVYSDAMLQKWKTWKSEPCSISEETASSIKTEYETVQMKYTLLLTLGIALCILCSAPAILIDTMNPSYFWENMSGAFVLLFIGFGVFFIVFSQNQKSAYSKILKLNGTMDTAYFSAQKHNTTVAYKNPIVNAVMSLYWATITCIYLCWSFLTFDWHISWIIWPVAALVYSFLKLLFQSNKEQ